MTQLYIHLIFFSTIVYHRILSIVPCALFGRTLLFIKSVSQWRISLDPEPGSCPASGSLWVGRGPLRGWWLWRRLHRKPQGTAQPTGTNLRVSACVSCSGIPIQPPAPPQTRRRGRPAGGREARRGGPGAERAGRRGAAAAAPQGRARPARVLPERAGRRCPQTGEWGRACRECQVRCRPERALVLTHGPVDLKCSASL